MSFFKTSFGNKRVFFIFILTKSILAKKKKAQQKTNKEKNLAHHFKNLTKYSCIYIQVHLHINNPQENYISTYVHFLFQFCYIIKKYIYLFCYWQYLPCNSHFPHDWLGQYFSLINNFIGLLCCFIFHIYFFICYK